MPINLYINKIISVTVWHYRYIIFAKIITWIFCFQSENIGPQNHSGPQLILTVYLLLKEVIEIPAKEDEGFCSPSTP
jgi:hypothetical protein